MKLNTVHFKSSESMNEIPDNSIDLVITSPPYFNIKDYSMDGVQQNSHSESDENDMGSFNYYDDYIKNLLKVWQECFRVLKPNGKLCINVPLLPMIKKDYSTHYNRHIFDIQSDIQNSILTNTELFLLDIYIWERTNSTKKLMFGSYPYPRNFYAQNTIEFMSVYVKDGKPDYTDRQTDKENSKLSQEEWVELTKQIWRIPIPNKKDIAFGEHSAIMPEELVKRCVKLFSLENDVVLDPFTGSGTTLKIAHQHNRKFVGYELYENYKDLIQRKVGVEFD